MPFTFQDAVKIALPLRPGVSPDPAEAELDEEPAVDHAKAKARGERVLGLAERIASTLQARGGLRASEAEVRVAIFHVIAEELYGRAAVDVPTLRGAR